MRLGANWVNGGEVGVCEDGLGDWDLNGRWVGRFMGHEVKWVGYLGCLE